MTEPDDILEAFDADSARRVLLDAIKVHRWCTECGLTGARCDRLRRNLPRRTCCTDCRHPDTATWQHTLDGPIEQQRDYFLGQLIDLKVVRFLDDVHGEASRATIRAVARVARNELVERSLNPLDGERRFYLRLAKGGDRP